MPTAPHTCTAGAHRSNCLDGASSPPLHHHQHLPSFASQSFSSEKIMFERRGRHCRPNMCRQNLTLASVSPSRRRGPLGHTLARNPRAARSRRTVERDAGIPFNARPRTMREMLPYGRRNADVLALFPNTPPPDSRNVASSTRANKHFCRASMWTWFFFLERARWDRDAFSLLATVDGDTDSLLAISRTPTPTPRQERMSRASVRPIFILFTSY